MVYVMTSMEGMCPKINMDDLETIVSHNIPSKKIQNTANILLHMVL